jgi:transposase
MCRLSESERWRIIAYLECGRTAAWVADRMGVNIKTVRLWKGRHEQTGGVGVVRSKGRPPAMNVRARKRATDLLVTQECGGARYVAQELLAEKLTDHLVSAATVIRGAKRQSAEDGEPLTCQRGRPRKQLTAANKAQRLAFCLRERRRDWRRVMITDRVRFYHRYPGARVRPSRWVTRKRQGNAVAYRPNKPSCLNVYAGITRYGVTKLHIVTGTTRHTSDYKNLKGEPASNITKAEYTHVVARTLLPEGRRIFSGQGLSSWVLQQDGDPCHRAAKPQVDAWNTTRPGPVELLEGWPGNSPDLSPIENVWGWVDAKVAAMGCKTLDEYKTAVTETFLNIPRSMLRNLFDSIPRRLNLVIQRGGDKCGY